MQKIRHGDNPLLDLKHAGHSGYGVKVDRLVLKMADLKAFPSVWKEVHDIMWEYWPDNREEEKDDLTQQAYVLLNKIYEDMPKKRGWFWQRGL
jgi:hypothetical protein